MNHSRLFSICLLSVFLGACGSKGGSNGGGSNDVTSSSGVAVDGYLVGSTVTCDEDESGTADSGENQTNTDSTGAFTFSPACTNTVLISGGTNQVSSSTSYPFVGQLKAPAGSTVITPLTTLLVESNLTEAQLATLLGLPAGTNFKDTDPTTDLALYKATLAVQQIIQEMAEAFGAVPGDTTVYADVARIVATSLETAATPLINNDGTLDSALLTTIAGDINTDFGTPFSSDLATIVGEIETQSEALLNPAITSTNDLETNATTQQDPATTPSVSVATQDYIFLANDAVTINTSSINYATFISGASTGPISTVKFDFDMAGTPDVPPTVDIGLAFTNTSTNSILKLMISDVSFKNVGGQLEVSINSNTHLFIYGHPAAGTDINIAFNKVSTEFLSVDANNELTIDYAALSQRIIDKAGSNATTVSELLQLNGTYELVIVAGGLNIRKADASPLSVLQVMVDGATDPITNLPVPSINGYGLEGSLTISL